MDDSILTKIEILLRKIKLTITKRINNAYFDYYSFKYALNAYKYSLRNKNEIRNIFFKKQFIKKFASFEKNMKKFADNLVTYNELKINGNLISRHLLKKNFQRDIHDSFQITALKFYFLSVKLFLMYKNN